jgi:hypothetical protein
VKEEGRRGEEKSVSFSRWRNVKQKKEEKKKKKKTGVKKK